MSADNDKLLHILCADEQTIYKNQEWLLKLIPEIKPMIGFKQHNPNHCYDVWQHTVVSIINANSPILKLTMLFHDIGKPNCYTMDEKGIGHFYGHPKESCSIADTVLDRLSFADNDRKLIDKLIFNHDAQIPSKSIAVRRWLNKLGEDVFRLLIEVKKADSKAQADAVKMEKLLRIAKLEQKLNEVVANSNQFTKKDLAINGRDIIAAGITNGVEIGRLLDELVGQVMTGKVMNTKEELIHWITS